MPANTILSHFNRHRRDADLANSTQLIPRDDPPVISADVAQSQVIIERARQQFLRTSEHRVILHDRRKPIYIWSKRVVGMAIYRNLGTLEDRLERSVKHFEKGSYRQLCKSPHPRTGPQWPGPSVKKSP